MEIQEEIGNGGAPITACRTRFDRKAANTYGFTMFLLLLLREYIIMPPLPMFSTSICMCVSAVVKL